MLRFELITFTFAFLFVTMSPAADFTENRQIVVVVTDAWKSIHGKLVCFEKNEGQWKPVIENVDVTVGKSGLGVGIGLHGKKLKGTRKKEGDGKAPAGVFPLESGFGAKPLSLKRFSYFQSDANDRWVDDPDSRFYNHWVKVPGPNSRKDYKYVIKDWKSAESMTLASGLYDHVIVVGHNRETPVEKGGGSAIFMHAWKSPGSPTVGCTAMEKETVKRILEWLKTSSHPVLVQVPKSEIRKVNLPAAIESRFVAK